jgi:hypothetical protein|nr:MAG TPA: Nucleotide modification associated domain 1 [Caudoviricetes sp.]
MENSEQHIKEAFDACAKVRNEKAQLYGNAWRMVDYYTLVHIIYKKLHSRKETVKDICTAVYNYSLFASVQRFCGSGAMDELKDEEETINRLVEEADNNIKNIVSKKTDEYCSEWMYCPMTFLGGMMLLKVARLHHLRFYAPWQVKGRELYAEAITDALRDLGGYAILYLARTALDEEREKKAEKAQTKAPKAPKQ